MNQGTVMAILNGTKKNRHSYLIHYGYIDEDSPIKYEVTLGSQTLIKEYNRNEYFMETYSMDNGGVGIRPIYEDKVIH